MTVVFNLEDKNESLEISLKKKKILYEELITGENGSACGTEDAAAFSIQIPGKSVRIYQIFVPGISND